MTDRKTTVETDSNDEDTSTNVALFSTTAETGSNDEDTSTNVALFSTTAETDSNDEDTSTNVALFSTDTDIVDSKLHQLEVAPRAGNASYSLGRLEHDLRLLQSKWHAVEKEMSERDDQITALETEVESYQAKSIALEADLEEITADRNSLAEDLSSKMTEVDDWKSKSEDFDRSISDREEKIDVARREHEVLLDRKHQLEDDLAEQRNSAIAANGRLGELNSQNVELRVNLQELQDYIDGRKGDWDKLNNQLREYEDTIKGMSGSLESHDDVVASKEEENATLALKVVELERELAELRGRHTERESSQVELQRALDDQSRELGSLNNEAIRLQKDIEKLQKKLERRDATARSLRQDLKERNRDSSSLEDLLASEKSTIAELQVNLGAANDRIAELEAEKKERDETSNELGVTIGELRERLRSSEPTIGKQELRISDLENALRASEATEKELRSDATQAALNLDEMSGKATEQEIRSAELHAVLLETQSEQKDVEKELEAQRELVHVLECELNTKQENLDFLDRSADRLSAIGAGIRDLDLQIDDHWLQNPEPRHDQAEGLFEQPDEIFLRPEVLFEDPEEMVEHVLVSGDSATGEEIRYPLNQKEMTIGRSRKNDIWLNNKYISRVHARIKVDGSCVIIEDAGSTNGFLVNSEHLTRCTLKHGDRLLIGKSKFQYLRVSSA